MNPRQFDNIEKRIRAASEAEPAFDEQAWERMQTLLDKEEKKRRPFFWIWFPIAGSLLGIALWYFYSNSQQQTENGSAETKKSERVSASATISSVPVIADVEENVLRGKPTNSSDSSVSPTSSSTTIPSSKKWQTQSYHNQRNSQNPNTSFLSLMNASREKRDVEKEIEASNISSDTEKTPIQIQDTGASRSQTNIKITASDSAIHKEEITAIGIDSVKVNSGMTMLSDSVEQKYANRSSALYFLAYTALDLSNTRFMKFKGSAPDLRPGIGVGYQINQKWSLLTGFSVGHKKYFAAGNDYKKSSDPYWNNKELLSIDADCYVFEIPLLIRYDFKPQKPTHFFASLGFQSLWMKTEDYQYDYLYAGNPYVYQTEHRYTGNKHFSSHLFISGGITYPLSQRFALQAAPYLSLPLSGIGEGKVKLFSSGMQIGIKYNPQKK